MARCSTTRDDAYVYLFTQFIDLMRLILIGATGTIGRAVHEVLDGRHEVIPVSRSSAKTNVDIKAPDDLEALFAEHAPFDGVVCTAGEAAFGTLDELTDEDFGLSVRSKMMGQINVVRRGLPHLAGEGSFTLTSGVLSSEPEPGSGAISPVNSAVEAFARAASMELPEGVRVNVVSPPWVSATLEQIGRDPSEGLPATTVARAYVDAVEGEHRGVILDAREYA